MTFDEFVELNKTKYIADYPGCLGIMIANWMYCDWMAIYHADEWHDICEQIRLNT